MILNLFTVNYCTKICINLFLLLYVFLHTGYSCAQSEFFNSDLGDCVPCSTCIQFPKTPSCNTCELIIVKNKIKDIYILVKPGLNIIQHVFLFVFFNSALISNNAKSGVIRY